MEKREIHVIDYLNVLVQWKKTIIINGFFLCLIAAIISLIIPKWFTSRTTIMPPTGDGANFGLSSLMSNLPISGLGMGLGGLSEESNIFLAIINSRTIMETAANKFSLQKRYKTENMEETIRVLSDRISVKINDEGTISIAAKAKTPFFASDEREDEARALATNLANFIVKELDRLNKLLKTDRAKNTRILIESRYNQNLADLKRAEDEFRNFQQQYGVIALPEQTVATITAAAELKAQIIAKEVEVGFLEKFISNSHSELVRAEVELGELQKKYNEYKIGKHKVQLNDNKNYTPDLFIPLEDIPDLGVQYLRLYREVKLQETLLEFLLPQYEQAKIQESKNSPTVQVLDPAVLPIKRSSPKRMLIVFITGFLSFLFFLIAVYIRVNVEYMRINNPDRYNQIEIMKSQLKPKNWFK